MSNTNRDHPVGIIGLGIMGGAIGRNLVEAGWRVVGHDIEPARCEEAQAAGIELGKDAGDVASRAPHVLISLPNAQALRVTAYAIAANAAMVAALSGVRPICFTKSVATPSVPELV